LDEIEIDGGVEENEKGEEERVDKTQSVRQIYYY